MIINELVTNAIKHAFPDGRAGRIHVDFEVLDARLALSVGDDGVGLSVRGSTKGQGEELVRDLANELHGSLEIETTARGSLFQVSIPNSNPRSATLGPLGARLH
jgi:two-component sensor histidine kinase